MVMIGPAPLFSLSLFLSLDGVEKDLWWRHNDGKEQALLPDVLLHIINIARKQPQPRPQSSMPDGQPKTFSNLPLGSTHRR